MFGAALRGFSLRESEHPCSVRWVEKATFVVGLGQLGSLFAEGLLKTGRPIVPVLRGEVIELALNTYDPELIVVAVGEDDLSSVLAGVPTGFRNRIALLQNELRPDQWLGCEGGDLIDPTIVSVWFERKAGKAPHVVLPTVLYGPHCGLLAGALSKWDLPFRVVEGEEELCFELALKNLYILGLNFGGLLVGGSAGELLFQHGAILNEIVADLIRLEQGLLSRIAPQGSSGAFARVELNPQRLKDALKNAIQADPGHGCAGRSAPRRLQRTLQHAAELGMELPSLLRLQQKLQAQEAQQ